MKLPSDLMCPFNSQCHGVSRQLGSLPVLLLQLGPLAVLLRSTSMDLSRETFCVGK